MPSARPSARSSAPSPGLAGLPARIGALLCALRPLGIVGLALACSLPVPAAAQWKWRDKSGQINVSDRPPPNDVPEKDILGRPRADSRRQIAAAGAASAAAAASAPGAAAETTALEREVQARKRAADAEQAAKDKQAEEKVAAARAENCRNARGQLAALENGQRIARLNDKGEREILDDKARADEMRRARGVIGSDCR